MVKYNTAMSDRAERTMRLSQLFLPLLKESPADATIASHQLMLRAGMIRQVAKGMYSWLPLGQMMLKKVVQCVEEEMLAAGAQQIITTTLQTASMWRESGRYADGSEMSDETLTVKDRHGVEFLFSPTAEEMVTATFGRNLQSYRQLPANLFQISWKFRDEIRPRHGVMRAREFLMKDAYSFDISEEAAMSSYAAMFAAYLKVYRRLGLTAIPAMASAGSMGGSYSHEFHVLADNGESSVFFDEELLQLLRDDVTDFKTLSGIYARESEKHQEDEVKSGVSTKIINRKSIEVGHIFYLGQKYSKALDVNVRTHDGQLVNPYMGCYGIGVSRLVAAIIEANYDEKGIIWPKQASPFDYMIVNLAPHNELCLSAAESLYKEAKVEGLSVLYDDTSDTSGAKLNKADLLGIPWQIIIGPHQIQNGSCELKERASSKVTIYKLENLLEILASNGK